MKRCKWVNLANPAYVKYHDEEWGVWFVVSGDTIIFLALGLHIQNYDDIGAFERYNLNN